MCTSVMSDSDVAAVVVVGVGPVGTASAFSSLPFSGVSLPLAEPPPPPPEIVAAVVVSFESLIVAPVVRCSS